MAQIVNPVRRIWADIKTGPLSRSRERKAAPRWRTITDGVRFIDRSADDRAGIGADDRAYRRILSMATCNGTENRTGRRAPGCPLTGCGFTRRKRERHKQRHSNNEQNVLLHNFLLKLVERV